MAQSLTPWMGSFILNDTLPHQLSEVLNDSNYILLANQPFINAIPKCQFLVIGNDINNGGAKVYVGNAGLTVNGLNGASTSFYGQCLVASQQVPYYSMDSDLIRQDHIWVLTDTPGALVTVNMLTR